MSECNKSNCELCEELEHRNGKIICHKLGMEAEETDPW